MIQELNKFARKSGTKMALFSRAWVESPFRRPKINTLHEPRVEQRQGVPKMNIKLPKRVLKILCNSMWFAFSLTRVSFVTGQNSSA